MLVGSFLARDCAYLWNLTNGYYIRFELRRTRLPWCDRQTAGSVCPIILTLGAGVRTPARTPSRQFLHGRDYWGGEGGVPDVTLPGASGFWYP